jgi:hypothetical protein
MTMKLGHSQPIHFNNFIRRNKNIKTFMRH